MVRIYTVVSYPAKPPDLLNHSDDGCIYLYPIKKSEVIITHVRHWKHKADSDTTFPRRFYNIFTETNAHPNDHDKYP